MSVRDQLNQRPALSGALVVVILALVVGFILWRQWPRATAQRTTMSYFYDLNTKELFAVPASTIGPIETESGPYQGMPAGVRANVYCCGPLVKGAETFIGYLEVPTESVPEDLRPGDVDLSDDSEKNDLLIRRPDGDSWRLSSSPEGQEIMNELRTHCGKGKQLTYVLPPPQ